MTFKSIDGGVCAAKGYTANGVHCGLRKNTSKNDLALIVSEVKASAACVYTTNLVKGAPIFVTQNNIADGYAQAVICNSGNANTCNADGVDIAKKMCGFVEEYAHISQNDVIIASTGVIGQPLNICAIESGMNSLVAGLGDKSHEAAMAIMTTDTYKKEVAVSFTLGGKECKIGGIAKGSGMIAPNMATLLVFVTTDASITPAMLSKAVKADVKDSFNMISVDGDTSTNDMLCVMANGMAGNSIIDAEGEDFLTFTQALSAVTSRLCKLLAADGEGATKLLECTVSGANTKETAITVAKSVINSNLLKAAMFGADANWGRVLCAIGYSGADVDISKIAVSFTSCAGTIDVCKNGAGVEFSEEKAKTILLEKEIKINISLNDGDEAATAFGCDLTYDYVKINGDYRS